MSEVIGIFGERPPQFDEPNEALIRMLEDALSMAKSGRLQSLVGAGFTVEGNRLSLWGGNHQNVYEMLGALSWLQHEYVDRQTGDLKHG